VFQIVVPVTNDGNSPTRGLFINAACASYDTVPDRPFDPAALATFRARSFTIGTRATLKPIACAFQPEELEAFAARRRALAVFGRAWHRDAIDSAHILRAEFCYVLYGFVVVADADPGATGLARACDAHNCTDDECSDTQRSAEIPTPP
jgi:hypothetical protein